MDVYWPNAHFRRLAFVRFRVGRASGLLPPGATDRDAGIPHGGIGALRGVCPSDPFAALHTERAPDLGAGLPTNSLVLRWYAKRLTGIDFVGVLEQRPIGLKDRGVAVCIAVKLLRDFR